MMEVVGAVLCAPSTTTPSCRRSSKRRDRPLVPSRRRLPVRRGDRLSGQVIWACAEKPSLPRRQLGACGGQNLVLDLRISNNSRDRQRAEHLRDEYTGGFPRPPA